MRVTGKREEYIGRGSAIAGSDWSSDVCSSDLVGNETDKKSKLGAIQDWTTERIGNVIYM